MTRNTITGITSVLTGLQRARPFFVQAQSKAVDKALDKMTVLKANLKESTEPRDLAVLLSWEMAEGTFLKSNYSKGSRLDAAIQFVKLVVEAVQTGMIPGSIGSSLSPGFLINAEGVNPSGSLPVPEDSEYKEVLGQQLLEAAQGNQIEEALNLVGKGANVFVKGLRGTWLHLAAIHNRTKLALAVLDCLSPADQRQLLLFEKDSSNLTWLHVAAMQDNTGNTKFALAMLSRLSKVEQRQLLFEKNIRGGTCLHCAVWKGDMKFAHAMLNRLSSLAEERQLLLEKNDFEQTAADVARQCGHRKMAEALEKLAT